MVSFSTFTRSGDTPIYTQIVLYIRRGIAAGTIQTGDELPSRRTLSALLGVNPNTIQKACRILEDEGLIQSHSGAKSVISAGPAQRERIRAQLLAEDVRRLVHALRQSGAPKHEALALVEKLWDEDDNKGEDMP